MKINKEYFWLEEKYLFESLILQCRKNSSFPRKLDFIKYYIPGREMGDTVIHHRDDLKSDENLGECLCYKIGIERDDELLLSHIHLSCSVTDW